MKLLIATHNRGKLREFAELLKGLPYQLVTLDEVGIHDDVEETGATFAENARLKAEAYARASGMLTLAEDSGLEVDALGGEPGVRSKRYAGENKTDAERNAYLLERLREVPNDQRAARFHSVIAIADAQRHFWSSEGTCEGAIAYDERGTNGFGYDPIFISREYGVRTAELEPEVKNRISHRGRASIGARKILEQIANAQPSGA